MHGERPRAERPRAERPGAGGTAVRGTMAHERSHGAWRNVGTRDGARAVDETARHLRRRELNSACSERDGTAAAFGAWRTDSRPATDMLMTGPRRTVRFFVPELQVTQS